MGLPLVVRTRAAETPAGLRGWKQYRWEVYTVQAASFYDDRLCRSAFGIDAAEVARRVEGVVPWVSVLQLRDRQGVLIQTVPDFVPYEELVPIRAQVMAAIRGERASGT